MGCMELVPEKSRPRALTVCQFDPDVGYGDCIADIAIHATLAFVDSLLKTGGLRPYNSMVIVYNTQKMKMFCRTPFCPLYLKNLLERE